MRQLIALGKGLLEIALNLEIWKYIAVREDERFELKDVIKSAIFNETAFDDRIIE